MEDLVQLPGCFSTGFATVNGQNAADENRQALMLCAIVIIFLVSNLPRNFISLYESIHLTR